MTRRVSRARAAFVAADKEDRAARVAALRLDKRRKALEARIKVDQAALRDLNREIDAAQDRWDRASAARDTAADYLAEEEDE